ncbi:hypothetical protein FQZ97_1105630 [compost metagenome]
MLRSNSDSPALDSFSMSNRRFLLFGVGVVSMYSNNLRRSLELLVIPVMFSNSGAYFRACAKSYENFSF